MLWLFGSSGRWRRGQQAGAPYHEATTDQPGSRYWLFQSYGLAIFLGLALMLAGLCFWWIRHRIS